jgi:ComEC/Rec2-related protein
MFNFLRQRAFLQLFVTLALGTWIGYYAPPPLELLTGDWLLLVLIMAGLGLLWWCWRDRAWAILLGGVLLCYMGYLNAAVATRLPLADPLRALVGSAEQVRVLGEVDSIPKYRNGHLRFMLAASGVAQVGAELAAQRGQCQVYVKCAEPPAVNYGDIVELVGRLEEIAPPANRGQFDYRAYLLQRGTVLVLYVESPGAVAAAPAHASPWPAISSLQLWLTGQLARGLPPELGALAVSVVYGDKITDLSSATEERFRRAGLTHILVASGTQVSLLMVLLGLLGWRQAQALSWRGVLRNMLQFCGVLAVLLLYAALTGFETSILRALVMGILVMLGRLASREVDGMTVLAQAGLVILLLNPLLLFAVGFQLSFGATFGLIYVNGVGLPRLAHLRGFKHWVALLLLSTGGAQLFVAPILLAKFNQLSLWGVASNLIAIPLAFALLIAGGLASLGLGAIPLLGTLLTWVVWALAWLLNSVAALFAALPGSNLAVPTPPAWWLALLYAVLLVAGEWVKHHRRLAERTRYALNWGTVAAGILLAVPVLAWWILPRPGLTALALERNEAYLWRSQAGRTILIARSKRLGRNHNADTLAGALRCRGVNRLHGVIWLDAPPEGTVLEDWPAPQVEPGAALPPEWGLAWLAEERRPWGLAAKLGAGAVWLAWWPPPEHRRPEFSSAAPAPAACLASAWWWEHCPYAWRDALAAQEAACLGCAANMWTQEQAGVEYLRRETAVAARGDGVVVKEYQAASNR